MSALNLRLPESIHRHIREIAKKRDFRKILAKVPSHAPILGDEL